MIKCIKNMEYDNNEVLFIKGSVYKMDSKADGFYYMVAEDGSSVAIENDFEEYFKVI